MDRAQTDTLFKHWRWEQDRQGLAWLTFDKQGESTNTFSREALVELGAALDAIAAAKPKGLVIRSAKENFIAGADINEFTRFATAEEAIAFTHLGWETMQKLRSLPFPSTAMVNGFCMGGGLELALACTYRVALDDPKTRFAFPEVMLGIWPLWHGLQWLPKLVGPAAALDMLLTGRAVDARRAKKMGLATEAVPLRILAEEGLPRYRALQAEQVDLDAQNERMRREVRDLQREVEALRSDPGAIERIARDELGMVRPGEVIFQFNE